MERKEKKNKQMQNKKMVKSPIWIKRWRSPKKWKQTKTQKLQLKTEWRRRRGRNAMEEQRIECTFEVCISWNRWYLMVFSRHAWQNSKHIV